MLPGPGSPIRAKGFGLGPDRSVHILAQYCHARRPLLAAFMPASTMSLITGVVSRIWSSEAPNVVTITVHAA
jgi:hypothetical protein